MRVCLGICVVMRTSAPESALVDLQAVVFRSTEYHGTHAPVADRQSFCPRSGRFVERELETRFRCLSQHTQRGYSCQNPSKSRLETHSLAQHSSLRMWL